MSVEDELLAIRLELKGVSQTVGGLEEVNKAQKGVGSSTRAAGEEAKVAERSTLSLGTAYGTLHDHAKLALGFIGVGGALALEKAVENTETLATATSGLSRNFGFSTNQASRWAAVMQSREIDPKALSQAFGTLSSKMVEAGRKGGTALTPFHQLGLSQEEVQKGAKNFEWGLFRVTKALGDEEGGAKRSAAAKALLGKGFQTLTPLMSEGTKGLKEQLHWADEYGVTLNKTSEDGLFGMVKSQRELKVATLGIEVAMTKAARPAIEGAEDQMKDFIRTINDPHLSAAEKIDKIEEQFEGLENDLIHVIEQALPGVAEHAGQLGLKMGVAVWNGFLNSDTGGRLAIGAYIFTLFGGGDLIKAGARKAGGRIGTEFGIGLATGATGAFIAYEIWEHLSQNTQEGIERWATHAGEDFVNAFVKIINFGIREINETFDLLNPAAAIGVEAPNIGEVGEIHLGAGANEPGRTKSPKDVGSTAPPAFEAGLHGTFIPGGPEVKRGGHKHGRRNTMFDVPKLPEFGAGFGAGRPIVIHHQTIVDGRVVAESVTEHAEDEAALR